MIPHISTSKVPVITVTARQATTGHLIIPILNENISFSVNPSQSFSYDAPSELKTLYGTEPKGVHVTSELDVSVQLKMGYGNNGDAVRVLKVLDNSKEFIYNNNK